MGKRSKTPREANLLDLVPERIGMSEPGEGALVTLLMPRFRHAFLRRLVEPRLRPDRRYFKLHLDDIGSAVWELCDGKRTVREIAETLAARFPDKLANQPYERLGTFLQQLERGRFISFVNLEKCLSERGR